jgi:hypothetical protein
MSDTSTDTIPNLWPQEFSVSVKTPLAILRVQANYLGKVTRGILEGAVETEASKERVQHRLVVIAPAYNGYRHTLITSLHSPHLPYPAEVRAEALGQQVTGGSATGPIDRTAYPQANSEEQMLDLVQRALRSDQTAALIHSLIAMSNDSGPRDG